MNGGVELRKMRTDLFQKEKTPVYSQVELPCMSQGSQDNSRCPHRVLQLNKFMLCCMRRESRNEFEGYTHLGFIADGRYMNRLTSITEYIAIAKMIS